MCNTTILILFRFLQSKHGVFNHDIQHSQTAELPGATEQLHCSSLSFSALLNETTTVAEVFHLIKNP